MGSGWAWALGVIGSFALGCSWVHRAAEVLAEANEL